MILRSLVLALIFSGCATVGGNTPEYCPAYGLDETALPNALAAHDARRVQEIFAHNACFTDTPGQTARLQRDMTSACTSSRSDCEAACEGVRTHRPDLAFDECSR